VPYDLSFYQVNHQLCNIGRMIRDAFEIFAHERQTDGAGDCVRIFNHEGEQLTKQLLGQRVDEVVGGADFSGQFGVVANEGIEGCP
jgi:hypothetical protein